MAGRNLTNLDLKGTKRSVKIRAINHCKEFSSKKIVNRAQKPVKKPSSTYVIRMKYVGFINVFSTVCLAVDNNCHRSQTALAIAKLQFSRQAGRALQYFISGAYVLQPVPKQIKGVPVSLYIMAFFMCSMLTEYVNIFYFIIFFLCNKNMLTDLLTWNT